MTDLSHLVQAGARVAVRVTPRAGRNALVLDGGTIRVTVTAVPQDGKANAAVIKLLAKSLGIAPTRLTLLRGAGGRDKLFQID